MAARLSPLDTSFLEVESPTAHMHVGWVALFSPPKGRPAPTFQELREHIRGRLGRAPRYRQKLARGAVRSPRPGLGRRRQVRRQAACPSRARCQHRDGRRPGDVDAARARRAALGDLDRPKLADGRIGVVGKAHHCMVDGIAAVELAALLLDPTPRAAATGPRRLGARRASEQDRVDGYRSSGSRDGPARSREGAGAGGALAAARPRARG